MRRIALSRGERAIEAALLRDEYRDVDEAGFAEIAQAVAQRRKDTVLSLRVNSQDLKTIKQKAKRHGIRYQTFISELLHRVAHG